jgi:hypothetical protein
MAQPQTKVEKLGLQVTESRIPQEETPTPSMRTATRLGAGVGGVGVGGLPLIPMLQQHPELRLRYTTTAIPGAAAASCVNSRVLLLACFVVRRLAASYYTKHGMDGPSYVRAAGSRTAAGRGEPCRGQLRISCHHGRRCSCTSTQRNACARGMRGGTKGGRRCNREEGGGTAARPTHRIL